MPDDITEKRVAASLFAWADQNKVSQADLAKTLSVSPQAVTNWKRRGVPARQWQAAASLMKTSVEALTSGDRNVVPADIGSRKIPIISLVQAGKFSGHLVDFYPDAFLMTDLPLPDGAFALEIVGTSMEPLFSEGDRVIIDPSIKPQPGDYVVAQTEGDYEATFKKYRLCGIAANGTEVVELVPLNPDFPTVRSDVVPFKVVGVMVEHRIYRKRR